MSTTHILRLFLLNVVLFGTCSAFAGLIVGDWVPEGAQLRVLAAFGLVPLIIAAIATAVHAYAGKWTSADMMSERFLGNSHPDR